MAEYETVKYEHDGPVVIITLNRPERLNAVNRKMTEELPRAWQEFETNPQAVVAILTGAGRAFCAGADLKEVAERGGFERGPTRWVTPRDCGVRKPVVAAVNGVCAGGGLGLVADCDIIICSENALFTDPRVSRGVVSIVGTIPLARRLPLSVVLQLALSGGADHLTAQRACEIGLVNQVVTQAALMDVAKEMARKIAKNSPAALIASKKAVWDSLNVGLDEALQQGLKIASDYLGHPDIREGPQAFVEKREPRWAPLQ